MDVRLRRPPLPTYEEATKQISRQIYQCNGQRRLSGPVPLSVHVRTGSDPAKMSATSQADHRLLRSTHSSIGFSENGSRTGRSGLPPVSVRREGECLVRTAHPVRTLRTHSSIGCAADSVQMRRLHASNSRMAQAPQKPARKFPPILENSRAKHYGSNGYFGAPFSALSEPSQDLDLHGSSQGPYTGSGMGSSPNLTTYAASISRNRNSCVSLGDDDKLFHAASHDLLHYRPMLKPSSVSGSPLRKSSASTESLRLPSPVVSNGDLHRLSGQHREALGRPDSATHLVNMTPPASTTRIHTNGSLQHLLQAQQHHQQRQACTGDLSPPEKANGAGSVHGDLTDNVSVTSTNSTGSGSSGSSGSDSGKATSDNSGDPALHDDTLLLMDDFSLSGMSLYGKSADTWKMLPDVSRVPWNEIDIEKVLQSGRLQCLHEAKGLSPDLTGFLAQVLRYPFLRICMEISRISQTNQARCSKRDVLFAAQRILPFSLFLTGKTACHQAGAFYASSLSQDQTKNSKSAHSGLKLDVGKVQGFMVEKKLGKLCHDLSAVYLTAILQNLLEELILSCEKNLPANQVVTSGCVERRLLDDSQYFGLFQTWRHLQAGKNVTNKACLPDTLPVRSLGQVLAAGFRTMDDLTCAIVEGCNVIEDSRKDRVRGKNLVEELTIFQMHWSSDALMSLLFFLGPDSTILDCADKDASSPPLIEWLRVIEACASYRRSSVCEKEDVMESARILLPGIDYPPHLLSLNDELQYFQAITKPRLLNDFNQAGLTPLMIGCMRGDYQHVRRLLAAGAKVNLAVPPIASPSRASYSRIHPDSQNWTALHFAVARGSMMTVKGLLDHGAWVEGAETRDSVLCETPLQLAAAFGMDDVMVLLLAKGADPCLSTISEEPSFSADAQRGTQAALVLAAAHGRRHVLSRMLSALSVSSSSSPTDPASDDTVSLAEILQEASKKSVRFEGVGRRRSELLSMSPTGRNSSSSAQGFPKEHTRILQTALYHAAENGFLEIVAEISYYGVPWRIHNWTRSISLLKSSQIACMTEILAGYWTLSAEELIESSHFVCTVVPVLFQLLTGCQHNRSVLSNLYKIISNIYGPEAVPPIPLDSLVSRKSHLRLNDQATADVVFRVEGVHIHAHRDVVMGQSSKFRELLTAHSDRRLPIDIFNAPLKQFSVVMQYLYEGGWQKLNVFPEDVLELMATAHYFALSGLMRYCESVWTRAVSPENVLSTHQQAKLFSALDLATFCDCLILQSLPQLAELQEATLSKFLFGESGTCNRLNRLLCQRILYRREILSKSTQVI